MQKIAVGESVQLDAAVVKTALVMGALQNPYQENFVAVVLDTGLLDYDGRYLVGWAVSGDLHGPDLHSYADLKAALTSMRDRWDSNIKVLEELAALDAASAGAESPGATR